MERLLGLLGEILNYILNVLDTAWTSLAHTIQVEVAAIMISPGLVGSVLPARSSRIVGAHALGDWHGLRCRAPQPAFARSPSRLPGSPLRPRGVKTLAEP